MNLSPKVIAVAVVFSGLAINIEASHVDLQPKVQSQHFASIRAQGNLFSSIRDKRIKDVQEAINDGADPNLIEDYRSETGMLPLSEAAHQGNIEIVRLLLRSGARVNLGHSVSNETALHAAADSGHFEIVRMLVEEYDADIYAVRRSTGRNGIIWATRTAEQEALFSGHMEIARYLRLRRQCSLLFSLARVLVPILSSLRNTLAITSSLGSR